MLEASRGHVTRTRVLVCYLLFLFCFVPEEKLLNNFYLCVVVGDIVFISLINVSKEERTSKIIIQWQYVPLVKNDTQL